MCCCAKPNKNGEPGFCWNPPAVPGAVYRPSPPAIEEGETLLADEPGRCRPFFNGAVVHTDYHSHHFRLTRTRNGEIVLYVQHGGGRERWNPGYSGRMLGALCNLAGEAARYDSDVHTTALPGGERAESDARYLFLHTLYEIRKDADGVARKETAAYWRLAAAEKRIKVRKVRGRDAVTVEIEERKAETGTGTGKTGAGAPGENAE